MEKSREEKSFRVILGTLHIKVFRHGKSIVVQKNLANTNVKTQTKIEVHFELFQPDDFPKAAEKFMKLGIDAEKIFGPGDMCIVGEVAGRIVHWTWFALNGNYVMEMEKRIQMPSLDSAYVYAGYTVPEYRGLRIAPKAEEEMYNHLHNRGIKRVFGLIESSNFPSLKYHRSIGFRKIGTIRFIRILGLRLYLCRGETEKDCKTIRKLLSSEKDRSKFQLIC